MNVLKARNAVVDGINYLLNLKDRREQEAAEERLKKDVRTLKAAMRSCGWEGEKNIGLGKLLNDAWQFAGGGK